MLKKSNEHSQKKRRILDIYKKFFLRIIRREEMEKKSIN